MGFDPNKITYFAKTDARGQQVSFGIKAGDRQRHMYVIGKTGMGKSTLLENMAAQDILNGEGMAFIDPHGSAIDVLLDYVPEHRLDDVVYFAPFDMEHPISFNVMEDVGADKRHLVVSGLMSTFKKIWVDAWSARMEYILTNALLALIEYPNTTLLSVNRMLADARYRNQVVDYVKDPAVKAYWVDEFANYTERFAAEALPAIQNKIGQFTGNPLIRNIIGQPKSSFDIRKMMDEKKILLVNLSKGLVGETNADLLGSMLTTRIYLGAMSRADLPVAQMKQMPNFYFYVDEFQSFANATFANILSEARKYHLNLIIAHQYVEQMEEDVKNAVFGNVGTTVTFRVGPLDAEALEPLYAPTFEATDLVNLGKYQIYLSLMIDGIGSRPFSAVTLPPVDTPEQSYRDMVIARSRQNFAKPRAEVEQLVVDLHTPQERADASAQGDGGNKGAFNKPAFGTKVGQNGSGNNGNGKKKNGERAKPNFENTILEKLRAQKETTTEPQKDEPVPMSKQSEVKQPEPTRVSHDMPPKAKVSDTAQTPSQPTPVITSESPRATNPESPTETATKSLEELRSVLKKISDAEKAAPTDDRPQKSSQNHKRDRHRKDNRKNQHQRPAGPGSDLKSALAAAVGERKGDEPSVSKVSSVPEQTRSQPEKVESTQRTTDTPPPVRATESPQVAGDDISPKQLERMMRVTTYDKPPL